MFFLLFAALVLLSCERASRSSEDCSAYYPKEYTLESVDASLHEDVMEYYEILLDTFDVEPLDKDGYEGYHLQYYSSHGFGHSIKFMKYESAYSLRVRCKVKDGWNDECKSYNAVIDEEDWIKLEKMIYEYDFWTAENYRNNPDVLDGSVYLLEGVRNVEPDCDLITHKFVARGSPRYDKIGDLCGHILDFESGLSIN